MNHKAIREELYILISKEEDVEKKEILDGLVKYTFVVEDTLDSMNANLQQAVNIINELNTKVAEQPEVVVEPEKKATPKKKTEDK